MNQITIEMIEQLRTHANVGFKESKETLEKFNGDMVQAMIYLEEQAKVKSDYKFANTSWFKKGKKAFKKLNEIDVHVYKNGNTKLRVPATLFLLFCLTGLPAVVIGAMVAALTGCKIKLHKGEEYLAIKGAIGHVNESVQEIIK